LPHTHTHTRIHAYTHARMHACTHTHTHTHAHIHTRTHTHTHTCTHTRARNPEIASKSRGRFVLPDFTPRSLALSLWLLQRKMCGVCLTLS